MVKLARLQVPLSDPEFKVVKRTRIKNQAVDTPIQSSNTGTDNTPLEDDVPEITVAAVDVNNKNERQAALARACNAVPTKI